MDRIDSLLLYSFNLAGASTLGNAVLVLHVSVHFHYNILILGCLQVMQIAFHHKLEVFLEHIPHAERLQNTVQLQST